MSSASGEHDWAESNALIFYFSILWRKAIFFKRILINKILQKSEKNIYQNVNVKQK